jgi:hypothetical protein
VILHDRDNSELSPRTPRTLLRVFWQVTATLIPDTVLGIDSSSNEALPQTVEHVVHGAERGTV